MKLFTLPLAFLLICSVYSGKSLAQAFNTADSLALVDLYNNTGGPHWLNHTNWLTDRPVSSWYGVYVDSIRVSDVVLPNNNLIGSLPASIGNFPSHVAIDLAYNRISGPLPTSIGNLSWGNFDLSHNQLSGVVPDFPLDTLVFLNISYNNFTFSDLEPFATQGRAFYAVALTDTPQADLPLIQNGNILSVSAGGTVANNTYTWYKDGVAIATKTGDSSFTMTGMGNYGVVVTNSRVPSVALYSIQNTNMQDSLALIDLYSSTTGSNWLNNTNWNTTAPVSTWYGVVTRFGKVSRIDLTDNGLSGTVPGTLGNLQDPSVIALGGNQLTGSIPESLGNLPSLTSLTLGSNQLTGNIPASFGNLVNLGSLDLSANQLTGNIPSALGNLASLGNLILNDNQFSGSIPAEFGNLSKLMLLILTRNQLTDTVPASIGNCRALVDLAIDYNRLTGTIPESFGRLKNLQDIILNDNQLTGPIPDSICYMPQLARLWVQDNQLTGSIPDSLGNDNQMLALYVQNNKLSGKINVDFSRFTYLNYLDISGNKYDFSALPLHGSLQPWTVPIYGPQQSISIMRVQSQLSVSAGGHSAHSTYTLFKDGAAIATQTGDSAFTIAGLGNYNIVTTNTDVPQFTLYSDTLKLGLVLPDSSLSTTNAVTGTSPTDINSAIFRLVTLTPTAGSNALSGNVTTLETVDTSIQIYNGSPYVSRHYDITPAVNPATAQATVMLYFTQADFDAYNTYVTVHNPGLPLLPTNGVDNGNVIITQYHGSFTGTSSPGNYSAGFEVITPSVVWDATDGWWEVSFPVTGFSGFFLSTAGSSPLPLTLLQFSGMLQGESVDLQWETSDEKNTRQFIVERSTNGSSFGPVGTVPAKSTNGQDYYTFTDMHPLTGSDLYRLKMQDHDGRFTYSPVVQVSDMQSQLSCQAYPNPATSATTLLFPSSGQSVYSILISDLSGRVIARLAGVTAVGLNKVDIGLQDYARGVYVITLMDAELGRCSIRLFKR